MKNSLFLKLISVLLILASMVTLVACSPDSKGEDEEEMEVSKEGLVFSLAANGMGYNLRSAKECIDENIVIPATYTDEKTSQSLPVTSIGVTAFVENKEVKSIYIPEGVTYIHADAFSECESLEKIEVSEANKEFLSVDGCLYTKDGKTLLKCPQARKESTLSLPDTVVTISDEAIKNYKNLKTIELNEGLKEIGKFAFSCCVNLESITFPDSMDTIGEAAFQLCSSMRSVTFGSGFKTRDTFNGEGEVTKYVQEVGKFAFYFCDDIANIKYNGTVADFEALNIDVSCFLSTVLTDKVECTDGLMTLPKLEGKLELPAYIGQ